MYRELVTAPPGTVAWAVDRVGAGIECFGRSVTTGAPLRSIDLVRR